MNFKIWCLPFLLLLSSCASQVSLVQAELESQEACCNSFSNITYTEIGSGFEKEFRMEKAQAYEFESGKSYFKAFKVTDDVDLELVSYVDHTYLEKAQIFWPSVITLGSDFQPIREIDNFPLKNNYLFTSIKGQNWGGKIDLNNNEKYVIIKTNQALIGERRLSGSAADGSVLSVGVSASDLLSTNTDALYTTYSYGGLIKVRIHKR